VTRVGIGYDSHRFVAGRPLILGGVTIPHPSGLAGHSDADAVAHALTDAILGAAGAGNIGQLFPDSDPQWKDADSMELLRTAHELVRGRGLTLAQADCSVITEQPRLAPHLAAMASALSSRLGVASGAISVKAKTNEGMGFIGRGEGLAVIAVAVLEAR
jgi:2-C-methyl-D-erythritol 2,4-cyclodiphosphate synthase